MIDKLHRPFLLFYTNRNESKLYLLGLYRTSVVAFSKRKWCYAIDCRNCDES